MGTAVLFPQDCLRPRSRHKYQASEMIYPSECAPVSKRNPPPLVQSQEDGLLPLPGHGRHSLPMNVPRKGSNANHSKCRKGTEQKDIDYSSRSVSDAPIYKILQRPKQGDVAVDVLAQFVVLDNVMARSEIVGGKNLSTKGSHNDSVNKCKDRVKAEYRTAEINSDGSKRRGKGSDTKTVKVCQRGASVSETKYVSKLLDGVHASFVEGYKLPRAKVGAVKPKNTPLDKVHAGHNESVRASPARVAPKPFSTKATGKVMDVFGKAAVVQPSEGTHSLVSRLRRTSTEPQISTTHILGQYKSKVIHISLDKSKSESDAHRLGLYVNTSSMSCQERWAGPGYTSSPSPSSLPLPKLCLPQTRFSSLEIPPLSKQFSSSVYMQHFLGSSAPSKMGGAWDVAFATKNLRKMLNLDPCE